MHAKCHPLLYDIMINSPSIIRLNAIQAFLLGVMKLPTYLQCFLVLAPLNPNFVFGAIIGSFK
jgi:hypothetical protein